MNLLATQAGTKKKVATSTAKIEAPCFQTIDITTETSYDLVHTPKAGTTPKVYVLNGDGTLGEKVVIDTTASAQKIAIAGNKVTVVIGETGYKEGDQLFFMYNYDADGSEGNGAVEVENSATNFPVGCKFIMEILGCDVCDQTNKRVA